MASRYREAPKLDANALENTVALCASVEAATAYAADLRSAYDRCQPLALPGMDQTDACASSVGGGRLMLMRRGARIAVLSSDSTDVGGLPKRTLRRLARIQARRL